MSEKRLAEWSKRFRADCRVCVHVQYTFHIAVSLFLRFMPGSLVFVSYFSYFFRVSSLFSFNRARWMCFFWVSCFIFVVSSRRRQKNQIFVQRCAHETQANRSPYLSLAISEHGHFYFLINVFSNLFRENNNHRNETTKHVAFLRCSDFFVGSHRIVRLVGCDVSLTTAAIRRHGQKQN